MGEISRVATAIKAIEGWQRNRMTTFTPSNILSDFGEDILSALRLAAKDEAGPVASSADTANKPFVWMNFEHLEAYRAGKRGGVAWAAPERSDFYSVALYTSEPKAEAPTAAQDEAEPVAWRITDGEGDYEYLTLEPSESSRAWSRRYGREHEPLYAATPPTAAKDEARERVIEATGIVHKLKTWPEYFNEILSGRKPFEWRIDDRDFKLGDTLVLQEYIPNPENPGKEGEYTGREITKIVSYIFSPWATNKRTVVMSLATLSPSNPTRMQGGEK